MNPHRVFGLVLSAGGFHPLQTILAEIPRHTGACFIIMQHMSKAHDSLLESLLGKRTDIPVVQATNGLLVEADHLYTAPPGFTLAIKDGRFVTHAINFEKNAFQVFDHFLTSLASEYRDRAVAVILSGAGDDGKRGAVAVRQQGGLLLVQHPDSAEFRSIPEHVIDAGAPDTILPPEKLGSLIRALAEEQEKPVVLKADSSVYQRILAVLEQANGVDFTGYKPPMVLRRIARRMFLNNLAELPEKYLEFLESQPEEASALARDLLIGVSRFFRDPRMFELLRAEHLNEQIHLAEKRELRIWVAGCATGEEAYSFGILCLEHARLHNPEFRFKILASDINPRSIDLASQGKYPLSIQQDLPQEYLDRYFTRSEQHYQVSDALRSQITFFKHDMVEDIPFTNVDIVSCRNVFIYFSLDLQRLVSRGFGFALNTGGLLILSPCESLTLDNSFEVISDSWRIYRLVHKPRYIQSAAIGWRKQLDSFFGSVDHTKPLGSRNDANNPRDRILNLLAERYVPLILILNAQAEIVYVLGNSKGILHYPSGEPANDLSRIADASLRLPINTGLRKVLAMGTEVEFHDVAVRLDSDQEARFDLRLCLLAGGTRQEDLVAVLFEKVHFNATTAKASLQLQIATNDLDQLSKQRINELEEELFYTRQSLRSAVEELEATNEELQSANEEMQSGNEELQSTNEELQSTNEELTTLNTEYQAKVRELSEVNDDIRNLMLVGNIAVVFVDRNQCVRLASPEAYHLIHFNEQDLGRAIGNFRHRILNLDLADLIQQAQSNGTPIECEGRTAEGQFYLIRAIPFATRQREVTGVAINFLDITPLREKEHEASRLAAIVTQSEDAIILRDMSSVIVAWNQGAKKMYGWHESEVLHKDFDLIVPEELRQYEKHQLNLFLGNQELRSFETRRLSRDGREIAVWVTLTAIYDESGKLKQIASIAHDITEQRRLRHETNLAAVAFETIDGIMITDAEGHIVRVNQAFIHITGYEENEVRGRKPSILHSGKHEPDFYQQMWSSLATLGRWSGEIWNRNKFGRVYPEFLSISAVYDEEGSVVNYVGVFRDISEQKDNEAEIHKLAFYDSLTQLPNRRLFIDRMERAILHSARHRHLGALCFLDLDRFKNINDSLGHSIGDRLLVEVAKRLHHVVRQEDSIARFGGDEFVILLNNVGTNEREALTNTEHRLRNIIDCLDEPFVIDDHTLHSSASIGVTLIGKPDDCPEDLLRQADNAMYLAKKTGRHGARFFDPSLQAEADALLLLEKNLRLALENREFELHYQPLVDYERGCLGVESLIRWCRSDGTTVSPADFIPVCEESGLMHRVGKWVLKRACEQFRHWREVEQIPLEYIAVNISPAQFMHPTFVADVLAVLLETGMDGSQLELEITENLLLQNIARVTENMNRLKEEGIRFAIDDFGTGYSSLAYIKRLPVDKIKIDQTFIRDVLEDQDDASIVESIIAMSEKMKLDLIAEGVETRNHMLFLLRTGCRKFQGYYFSKPLNPEDFKKFYRDFRVPASED